MGGFSFEFSFNSCWLATQVEACLSVPEAGLDADVEWVIPQVMGLFQFELADRFCHVSNCPTLTLHELHRGVSNLPAAGATRTPLPSSVWTPLQRSSSSNTKRSLGGSDNELAVMQCSMAFVKWHGRQSPAGSPCAARALRSAARLFD